MKFESRLSEADLQATILSVLRNAPEPVMMHRLLRDLTAAVVLALTTGEAPR